MRSVISAIMTTIDMTTTPDFVLDADAIFGKYYFCRECQDMVRDGVRLFIDANRVKEA